LASRLACFRSRSPIFRDRDDFTAGHSLTDQTLAALDAAAALIVICSPASAKSAYVTEEIRLYKSRHPERPVIPLIVDGKPGDPELECFPPSLKFKLDADGKVTDKPVELLAADAREEGDGKHLALAKVVAGLLDVSSDDVFRRAERERRRKGRVRNSVIAGLAVLAVAATGSAVYAWHQLKTNEAFLTATLKTATEIVDEAVAQAEKHGVPRQATLALLTKAEGLFDNMALLGRPTPELRYQKAWMLIQFARNYAILGDTTKQKQRADEAQRLMAELAAEMPDDPEKLRTLAVTLEEKGNVLVAQGKLGEALKAYQDGLAIFGRLAKADPDNAGWQHALSVFHIKVGNVLVAQGGLTAALAAYQDSVAILDRLTKTHPGNAGRKRDLSVAYSKVGELLEAQGKLGEAFSAYRDSLAIMDRLAMTDSDNAGWRAISRSPTRRSAKCLWRKASSARHLKPIRRISPSETV
jgi:tetratricopeptide (TPR) repeat protein